MKTTESKTKITMKVIIIAIAISIFCTGVAVAFYYYGKGSAQPQIDEFKRSQDEMRMSMGSMSLSIGSLTKKKDSLLNINSILSKYRHLTDAMNFRDSTRKPLIFNIGDIAFLKRDSSRVLIKDIIIGGGQFEYYVKYTVLYKDNTTENISPELIYR